MAAGGKETLFTSKNREASERKRMPLNYVDFEQLLVFSEQDLAKELLKLPAQKLRNDDEDILVPRGLLADQRRPLRSAASQESLYSLASQSQTADHHRHQRSRSVERKRSSTPVLPSPTRPGSALVLGDFRSFFQVAQSVKRLDQPMGGHWEEEAFPFESPVPLSLRHLNMGHFAGTDIDWKMLTLARPPTKRHEMLFSRLVDLRKLHHKTKMEDGFGLRKAVFAVSRHPLVMRYGRSHVSLDSGEGSGGVLQGDFDYESYARCLPDGDLDEEGKPRDQAADSALQEQVARLMQEDFGDSGHQSERTSGRKKRQSRNSNANVGVHVPKVAAKEGKGASFSSSPPVAVVGLEPTGKERRKLLPTSTPAPETAAKSAPQRPKRAPAGRGPQIVVTPLPVDGDGDAHAQQVTSQYL
ncbi:hypothetical protein HDE_12116 [Halotydeus destructor]|nr:hypothetical protein HDE_12116 [Halotydeus destructor]